ncbi:MAG: class I SAM-dependent methyltransferase [Vulcanimicrobiaceae bacterium]
MQLGRPSRTALGAAKHRAAHQVLEQGRVFADGLALRILGPDAEAAVREAQGDPSKRRLRLFVAVRTRFAEDALAAAVERGLRQLVVLGAGLDTYAYRAASASSVRVFEVDHSTTQAWKRRRLAEAGIALPAALTFAPVDFEREPLNEALDRAGFDPARPGFFTWLGVVPYLTGQAVFATLGYIAGLPGGAHVVFDYANPPVPRGAGDADDAAREALAARVAAAGEPIRSRFETVALHRELAAMGFREIEDLGPRAIRERYFGIRSEARDEQGGHVVCAATV